MILEVVRVRIPEAKSFTDMMAVKGTVLTVYDKSFAQPGLAFNEVR